MSSFSAQEALFWGLAVLSMTGTLKSWSLKSGTRVGEERALWHMTAVKFPPAELPPIAHFSRSKPRTEYPVLFSQRRTSHESCTAAGYGFSGAKLKGLLDVRGLGEAERRTGSLH